MGRKPAGPTIEKILDLRGRGLTYEQIGKLHGQSRQAIEQRLRRRGIDLQAVKSFKKDEHLIIAAKQALLLDSIDKVAIEKMNPKDRLIGYGILHDKLRDLGRAGISGAVDIVAVAERALARNSRLRVAMEVTPTSPDGAVVPVEAQRPSEDDGLEDE